MCFRCYIQDPHTSISFFFSFIFFTRRRPSVGNDPCGIRALRVSGTISINLNEASFFLSRSSTRATTTYVAHINASTRCLPSLSLSFFFLLSGMMAPHAKSPKDTPTSSRSYHSHGTPVRFVRLLMNRSTRLIERASKCFSLFRRDAFVTTFGTNRTQKKPYTVSHIISRQSSIAVTWAERSEGTRARAGRRRPPGFGAHFRFKSNPVSTRYMSPRSPRERTSRIA